MRFSTQLQKLMYVEKAAFSFFNSLIGIQHDCRIEEEGKVGIQIHGRLAKIYKIMGLHEGKFFVCEIGLECFFSTLLGVINCSIVET